MEFVHTANTRADRKRGLESADLCIVRGDEEKVLQSERLCGAIRRSIRSAQQLVVNSSHPFDLFITSLDVSIMFDADENNAALLSDDPIRIELKVDLLLRAIEMRSKATLIDTL